MEQKKVPQYKLTVVPCSLPNHKNLDIKSGFPKHNHETTNPYSEANVLIVMGSVFVEVGDHSWRRSGSWIACQRRQSLRWNIHRHCECDIDTRYNSDEVTESRRIPSLQAGQLLLTEQSLLMNKSHLAAPPRVSTASTNPLPSPAHRRCASNSFTSTNLHVITSGKVALIGNSRRYPKDP